MPEVFADSCVWDRDVSQVEKKAFLSVSEGGHCFLSAMISPHEVKKVICIVKRSDNIHYDRSDAIPGSI